MTVRWRILAFVLASLLFLTAMIGVMAGALHLVDEFVQRIDGLHGRYQVVAELNGDVSDYAIQASKTVLLGPENKDELEASRIHMERTMAQLARETRAEIATLRGMAEIQQELPELENNRRMLELYRAIDAGVGRALSLQQEGRTTEAQDVFSRDVEFRLFNELQPLMQGELEDERAEVETELASIRTLQSNILWGAGAITLLGLTCVSAIGFFLFRSVARSLDALSQGAQAIAAGRMQHRIAATGTNEFAALARTFNHMADAIEGQRTHLLLAGERLASEVDARTEELRGANELLRALDDRRSQFLADVSHQLRTPLTILRGEADVALRMQASKQEQHQSLELIQAQAAELSQLLEDLIAFARSEAEGVEDFFSETRLRDVVLSAAQEGAVLAEPEAICVTTALKDDGSVILGDARRLKHALMIGLENAVQHSHPGASIHIETSRDGNEVHVRILDDGEGISPEDEAHVFERYYRGRSSGRQHPGLGIGLAIAKDIVERHKGRISLQNRPTGGAMLEITLPIASGTAP